MSGPLSPSAPPNAVSFRSTVLAESRVWGALAWLRLPPPPEPPAFPPPQMLMLLSPSWLPGSSAHVGPGGHPGLHHPRLAAGPALLWHVWVQVRGLRHGWGAPKAPGGPKNFTATPSSPGARDLALPRARLPSTAEQAQVPAAITSLLSFQAEPEVGGENPQPQQEPPVPGRTRLGGRPGW